MAGFGIGDKLVLVLRLSRERGPWNPGVGWVGCLSVYRTVEEAKAVWPDSEFMEIQIIKETENVKP